MAVKIRLTRLGRKKRPFYRIVVADSRAPRDGRYIECIGTYNPVVEPPELKVEADRANLWLDRGAIPSDTVKSLLKKDGILFKRSLNKRGLDDAQMAEEMKKWEALQIQREKEIEEKKQKKEAEKAAAAKAEVTPAVEDAPVEVAEEPAEEPNAEDAPVENTEEETAPTAEAEEPPAEEVVPEEDASSKEEASANEEEKETKAEE